MTKIDMSSVINKAKLCGKKLKVKKIVYLLYDTFTTLDSNQTIAKCKEVLGEELYEELSGTIMTFFSLNIMANTHKSKEFDALIKECEIEEESEERL